MLVAEADKPALKDWILPRLEQISDADPAVLADYVIALVAADEKESEASLKHNCMESLFDFLQEHTAPFIDEVLASVRTKSFLPKTLPEKIAAPVPTGPSSLSAQAPPFNPPTGPKSQHTLPGLGTNPAVEQPRKRRFNERETSQSRDNHDMSNKRGPGAERPFKQAARGGRGNRGGGPGRQDSNTNPGAMPFGMPGGMAMPLPPMPAFPGLQSTPPVPGFSPFDPNNPMAMFAMLGMNMTGMPMPPMPPMGMDMNLLGQPQGPKKRCHDYDTKGFCAIGSACPFEHGGAIRLPEGKPTFQRLKETLPPFGSYGSSDTNTFSLDARDPSNEELSADDTEDANKVPEYDPNKAFLAVKNQGHKDNSQNRSRPSRGTNTFSRARAPFSQLGPTSDRSNTKVVVEQIPEEFFSEDAVKEYFSGFGTITDVSMQGYKRLAIVTFEDHSAARAAYESPKAVFDNRFVKVYWYKPETAPTPSSKDGSDTEVMKEAEETLDPEEFAKRQAEAQKAFEDRQKKLQQTTEQMVDVEKELMSKEEELRELRRELARKSRTGSGANGDLKEADLLKQLETLQAEAQNLNTEHGTSSYSVRGRGGYRGRASYDSYPPPARGYNRGFRRASYRGARAHPFASGRAGVKRLDNRPKRISVSGVAPGSKEDEALRQHLVNNFETESIDTHPEDPNTQIITFKERYMAEMFADQAMEIPDIGEVELAWVANAPLATTAEPTTANENEASDKDVKMEDLDGEANPDGEQHAPQPHIDDTNLNGAGGEADYDVADDEDRWMAA